MKEFTFLLISVIISVHIYAQEFATDFEVEDCSGTMHHLFDELDNGYVIIIAWIMPCGSCIQDPSVAFAITETITETYPDKVRFYIADDYANTSCSSLLSWCNTYGLGKATLFSDPDISMSDYGQDGMPKIVILGGGEMHKVYFNKNSSTEGFQDALELAIAESAPVGINELNLLDNGIKVFPNPATEIGYLQVETFSSTKIQIELFDASGKLVFSKDQVHLNSPHTIYPLEISTLDNGNYIVSVTKDGRRLSTFFSISNQ